VYPRFGLVLMVTHACNLRCSYCYTGHKTNRTMPGQVGRKAIDRAIASLAPGGTLELGFFGGEPLLESELIDSLIAYARQQTAAAGAALALNLTTNGTVIGPAAWAIMTRPDLELAVSCDGLPEIHDHHRISAAGHGSSEDVLATIRRLIDAGREFRVVMVVRPDSVKFVPCGIRFLQSLGVRHIEPSLDVWARWTQDDIAKLEAAVAECAQIWRDGLPHHSIGWFDEKAAHLARLNMTPTARCGFGHGELAVAPSGRLYPCERLIGDDADGNPMALPGHRQDVALVHRPERDGCDSGRGGRAVRAVHGSPRPYLRRHPFVPPQMRPTPAGNRPGRTSGRNQSPERQRRVGQSEPRAQATGSAPSPTTG
jgi:uncharacterized protein